jgi:AcrR family transcriptional regulator
MIPIVARPRSTDFLPRLHAAALRVFARQGLKHARMSDIAKEMGVAHGSLYNYVESKEALFYWLVDCGLVPPQAHAPERLPIRTKSAKALLARLREQIAQIFTLPHLEAALQQPSRDVRAELSAIIIELYERTFASRLQAAALERSAVDVPELFALFFMSVRRTLLAQLTRYIAARAQAGQFAPAADPATAARFVLETITFFARHRFNDPDLPPGDEDAVRRTIVDLLVRSLVDSTPRRRQRHLSHVPQVRH